MAEYEVTLPTGEVYKVNADSQEQLTAGVKELEATAYGGGGLVNAQGQNPQFNQAFNPSQDRPEMAPAVAAAGDEAVHGAADERGFWANLGNAALMDTGDEIMGTFGGLITMAQGKDFSEGYDKLAGAVRKDIHGYEERYPVMSTVGKIGGGLLTAGLPAGKVLQGANWARKALQGAGVGAAYGAGQGFAAGEGGVENRLESGAVGAVVGAGLGAGVGAIGAGLANRAGRRAGEAATPTTNQWTEAAQRLYQQADNAMVAVNPTATSRLAQVRARLGEAVADPSIPPEEFARLYPNSVTSLQVLDRIAGQPMNLRNVEMYRRMLLDSMMDARPESADERVASLIIRRFDDWVDHIHPSEFHNGTLTGPEARQMYREARRTWRTRARAQTLERIVERADNEVINDPGFRNQARAARYEAGFRRLLNNRELMRGYDGAERQAIVSAAGGTRGNQILRGVDLVTPGFSFGRIPQAGGWGLTGVVSPAIPAAAAVAGTTARIARNRNIVNAGRNASLPVRAGGANPFDAAAARMRELDADQIGQAAVRSVNQVAAPTPGNQVLDLGNVTDRGVPARYIPR